MGGPWGPLSSAPVRRILPPEYRAHLERRGDTADAGTGPAVTFRSILIGLAFCAVIAVCVPYGGMLIRGSRLGLSSATPAAFFALFLLLLLVQPLLRGLNAGWALRRGELIVVFFMMMIASAIPTRGVMGMLLPMISGHDYYATPQNRWEELVHPHLPEWLVVTDAGGDRSCSSRGAAPCAGRPGSRSWPRGPCSTSGST